MSTMPDPYTQIDNEFTYHPPTPKQKLLYEALREDAKKFAKCIAGLCPNSRETSLAYTKLQESVMWANASIALNTKEID